MDPGIQGTLRQNVDPAEEHQDVDIWEALSQVKPHYCLAYSLELISD